MGKIPKKGVNNKKCEKLQKMGKITKNGKNYKKWNKNIAKK